MTLYLPLMTRACQSPDDIAKEVVDAAAARAARLVRECSPVVSGSRRVGGGGVTARKQLDVGGGDSSGWGCVWKQEAAGLSALLPPMVRLGAPLSLVWFGVARHDVGFGVRRWFTFQAGGVVLVRTRHELQALSPSHRHKHRR